MNARKSKTAKRREQAASLVSQRTVTLTLALDDGQFSLLTRVAEQYNRLWGVLVSWCSQNHTVSHARVQKENYRRLREQFPMLPSQFVCIAMRDAAGAVRSWNSNNPKRRWNLKATRKAMVINYDQRTMSVRGNMLHQWSFSQLQEFTAYKAAANGIRIIMVDPSYTSQQCNRCGYVDAGNRNRARFDCKRCAWSDNADHNAAMNIRDRAIATLEHENTSTDRPVDRVQSTPAWMERPR